jgi:hypothetical protein
LYEQVAYVPPPENQLARLNAAETDKQHQKKQDRLCPAAYSFKNRTCSVDGGYLHVNKVRSCAGDHAYYKHPVF